MIRATRVPLESEFDLEYGAVTLYGQSFQTVLLSLSSLLFSTSLKEPDGSLREVKLEAPQPQPARRLV